MSEYKTWNDHISAKNSGTVSTDKRDQHLSTEAEVYGFRVWNITNKQLYSPYSCRPEPWEISMKAKCDRFPELLKGVSHQSPCLECGCGISAFDNIYDLISFMSCSGSRKNNYVIGIVCGTGKIIRNRFGWRAEKVRIVSLFGSTHESLSSICDNKKDVYAEITLGINGILIRTARASKKRENNWGRKLFSSNNKIQRVADDLEIACLLPESNEEARMSQRDSIEESRDALQRLDSLRFTESFSFNQLEKRANKVIRNSELDFDAAQVWVKDQYLNKDLQLRPRLEGNGFKQAALGFRAWGYNRKKYKLKSCIASITFRPGLNTSKCTATNIHTAPANDCHCGYNSWNKIDDALGPYNRGSMNTIIGAIAGFGNLEIHGDDGWRAEHAALIAILLPPTGINSFLYTDRIRIAQKYGVPVFQDRNLFEHYAKTQAVVPRITKQATAVAKKAQKASNKVSSENVWSKISSWWHGLSFLAMITFSISAVSFLVAASLLLGI